MTECVSLRNLSQEGSEVEGADSRPSVTDEASSSTARGSRLEISILQNGTLTVRNDLGIETMAHLTCVGSTRDEIREILVRLRDSGIENVLPLGARRMPLQ